MSSFKPAKGESWVQWFLSPHTQGLHLQYLVEMLDSEATARNLRDQQAFAAVHWFNLLDTAKGADKACAEWHLRRFMDWLKAHGKSAQDML